MKCYRRSSTPDWTPEQVLRIGWKHLPLEDMARYLRRVLVAERKCIDGYYPRRMRLLFKWRRLTVASLVLRLGGEISPLVFTQPHARCWSSNKPPAPNVPQRHSWPGVFELVPLGKMATGDNRSLQRTASPPAELLR